MEVESTEIIFIIDISDPERLSEAKKELMRKKKKGSILLI